MVTKGQFWLILAIFGVSSTEYFYRISSAGRDNFTTKVFFHDKQDETKFISIWKCLQLETGKKTVFRTLAGYYREANDY